MDWRLLTASPVGRRISILSQTYWLQTALEQDPLGSDHILKFRIIKLLRYKIHLLRDGRARLQDRHLANHLRTHSPSLFPYSFRFHHNC
jgi:hypothetical protein